MVTRVNGSPQEGLWFSADVVFATVTVTGATFQTDVDTPTVDSSLEVVIEALQQFGTVVGLRVTSETVCQVIVDYAQAYGTEGTTIGNQDGVDVTTLVEADINANAGLSAAAITNIGTDFTAG